MKKSPKEILIVTLRCYRSQGGLSGVVFNADSEIVNESQKMKLNHGTIEWDNFIKGSRTLGFVKYEVEKVVSSMNRDYSDKTSEFKEEIEKEVNIAFTGGKEVVLTPEQKQIKELQEQVKSLVEGKSSSKQDIEPELKEARERYHKEFGKKGHHSWTVTQIDEKIREKTTGE